MACSVPGQGSIPALSLGPVWAAPPLPPSPPLCMTTFYRKSQSLSVSRWLLPAGPARPAHYSPHLSVWLVLAPVSLHRLGLGLRGVLRRPVSTAGAGPAPTEAPPPGPGHSVSALGPAVTPGSPGGRGASVSLHTVSGRGRRVAAVP